MTDKGTFTIQAPEEPTHLEVSTVFIDRYMPAANGTFVKIYLSLLLCQKTHPERLSLTYLADLLGETISDIYRGLQYWEREGLLLIRQGEDGRIVSLTMLEPEADDEASAAARNLRLPEPPAAPAAPEADLDQLFSVIETYFGHPVSKAHVELIEYLYGELEFSEDLIDFLYEYCVGEKAVSRPSYIRQVALGWHKAGITTRTEAANEIALYTTEFQVVNKAFGLNRAPGKVERDYLNRWFRTWGFSAEMVEEACTRTLLKQNRPDFKYADGILRQWQAQGVFTKEALQNADLQHQVNTPSPRATQNRPAPSGTFFAFPQREIDEDEEAELERKLLRKGRGAR
ncbi:MAG: DnaD domain protein [Lachnospiraceae bacterium]|nr:DnaD domain protein [Lachnospiraceae bacterium]